MSQYAPPPSQVPLTVIRELDLPELTYSLSPPARPALPPSSAQSTLVLPLRSRPRPLSDNVQVNSSLGGSASVLPAVALLRQTRGVTFSPVHTIIPPARYSTDDGEGQTIEIPAAQPAPPTTTSTTPPGSPFQHRPPPSSPPPVAPLPRIPFDQHQSHIQGVIAAKRLAVRSAFLRQRALETYTLALHSTLGLIFALVTVLPLTICARSAPLGLKIALPILLYLICLCFGLSIEIHRYNRRRDLPIMRSDRSETRNLILNLSRLIHDISRLPKDSLARRPLLSACTKAMAETLELLRYYEGRGRGARRVRAIFCGPLVLLAGLYRFVHERTCSLACCIWTFGGGRRQRFINELSAGREEAWGLIDLSRLPPTTTKKG